MVDNRAPHKVLLSTTFVPPPHDTGRLLSLLTIILIHSLLPVHTAKQYIEESLLERKCNSSASSNMLKTRSMHSIWYAVKVRGHDDRPCGAHPNWRHISTSAAKGFLEGKAKSNYVFFWLSLTIGRWASLPGVGDASPMYLWLTFVCSFSVLHVSCTSLSLDATYSVEARY